MGEIVHWYFDDPSPILPWLKGENHRQVEGITLEFIAGILMEPDAHFKTGFFTATLAQQGEIN